MAFLIVISIFALISTTYSLYLAKDKVIPVTTAILFGVMGATFIYIVAMGLPFVAIQMVGTYVVLLAGCLYYHIKKIRARARRSAMAA